MKKHPLLSLLLMGLIVFSLTACQVPSQTPTQPVTSQQPSQTEATFPDIPDDQLYEKVYLETLDLVFSYPNERTALNQISAEQRVFYIVSIYDMEVLNGGLCQFFSNSSQTLAPELEECLEIVGAADHKALFADFVQKNQIDLEDLSSFRAYSVNEFIQQTQRFDYDSFDADFVELPPLWEYLLTYVRAHPEVFA